ncbi:Ger(x)C family spore germination protein [Aquibacillus kalidii]|uniref:Ger(x)C family spore germination protein n=1 Tax=Aquibacillus kalidii TaxID=2762597 RepID=UPI0016448C7C|nr:Ger(x)C family spore germination protein [Aquibacillus kalidii]
MTKKIIILLLPCILLLFITGCWNRRELNDLAISLGEGIDLEGDSYRISTQIVIPGEIASKSTGSSSNIPVRLFTTKEDTVFEAMREMTTVSPRIIYHSHLRVLVIGEELARKGIDEVLDYFSRDHELRTDFYIVIAKDTSAENVLSILTAIEKIPANSIVSSLETSEKTWAPTTAVKLDELIQDLVTEGKNPVLPGIEIIGDPSNGKSKQNIESITPSSYLKYSSIAVFKKGKMLGWLDREQSKGYNLIMNNVESTIADVRCPDKKKFNFEIKKSQAEVTANVRNNTPKINVSIKAEGNIGEMNCELDLTKQTTIEKLQKLIESDLKHVVQDAIKSVQDEYSVDIFGFGDTIHRSDKNSWKSLKKEWNEKHFSELEVDVKVDVKIRRLGKISNSFLTEIKE